MFGQTATEPQAEIEFDKSATEFISSPVDKAWQEAERIVGDTRYSPEYKRTEINKLFGEALAAMEDNYTYEIEKLDKNDPKLEIQARRPFAPPLEDAPRLLYTADAFKAHSAGMKSLSDLHTFWSNVVESGDLITARVLLDHGAEAAGRIIRKAHPEMRTGIDIDPTTRELMEKSEALLATPEQKKARTELVRNKETRMQIGMVHSRAKARLSGWEVRDGQLVDGMRARSRTFSQQTIRG